LRPSLRNIWWAFGAFKDILDIWRHNWRQQHVLTVGSMSVMMDMSRTNYTKPKWIKIFENGTWAFVPSSTKSKKFKCVDLWLSCSKYFGCVVNNSWSGARKETICFLLIKAEPEY
jgi:hypothetical protein